MRGSGRYGNSGGRGHPRDQMQRMPGHRMDHNPANYHGRPDPMASDKEHCYGAFADGRWRWESDGSKAPNSMSPRRINQGQRGDDSRSYCQGQRIDTNMGLERQGISDPLPLPRGDTMDARYEDNPLSHSFEGLEKKFMSDITKLFKETNDSEDAENARHREEINTINAKHEEQLGALRARYGQRRDEFLRRESQAREKQYQEAMTDSHQGSDMAPNDHTHGYTGEPARGNYNANQQDTYRERARFLGNNNARDHGFEQREPPYPGGRVYDKGSRYY